jgi:hypothetical protein
MKETALIAMVTEAASISETSVNFYQTTRSNNPKESHLHVMKHHNIFLPFAPDKTDMVMGHTQTLHGAVIRERAITES